MQWSLARVLYLWRPVLDEEQASGGLGQLVANDPGCSLTRGYDVKLSMRFLPASLFSPQ